ncbi:hypothetical protein [Sinomonas cellulolyticus]|uniref:PE-PGRS family protein n=1 Tax=Sinomonas cellulolyticus TaxID=2801916 RepID=A0ABS1K4H7_9MICC|nr:MULTISPECIES: hypothetical protein [Sinomonas]MBL0706277.1 hypothetical protein [Sinomonas cellulolyticus]
MDVGDELIYRVRDYAASERVRVVAVIPGKKNPRYEVEFLDGETVGRRENVPGSRLHGPWAGVRAFDEVMANWERFEAYRLTDPEETAVGKAFALLIPEPVAEWEWSPVRWTTTVHDQGALERIIGLPIADLVSQTDSFLHDGELVVSPAGTLMISECACRVTPGPVLEWVTSDEKEYRERAKHGRDWTDVTGHPTITSPEWEYQWYLERGRPVHELLRAWCGQRAVSAQERLAAAEAEVHRLDALVVRLIDELKEHGHARAAEIIAQTHEDERITPYNVRPIVDRPLKPSEIPIRYERAPRRWGY